MVYISGEEMTKHTMDLILEEWIRPHVDISAWEFYDLSCVSRASLRSHEGHAAALPHVRVTRAGSLRAVRT